MLGLREFEDNQINLLETWHMHTRSDTYDYEVPARDQSRNESSQQNQRRLVFVCWVAVDGHE